jgi:hypothetical protein
MRVTPIVDYHQLYLAPPEVWPVFDAARVGELVQVAPDRRSLIIVTGVAMGPVTLDVELVDLPGDDGPQLVSRTRQPRARFTWTSRFTCSHPRSTPT